MKLLELSLRQFLLVYQRVAKNAEQAVNQFSETYSLMIVLQFVWNPVQSLHQLLYLKSIESYVPGTLCFFQYLYESLHSKTASMRKVVNVSILLLKQNATFITLSLLRFHTGIIRNALMHAIITSCGLQHLACDVGSSTALKGIVNDITNSARLFT